MSSYYLHDFFEKVIFRNDSRKKFMQKNGTNGTRVVIISKLSMLLLAKIVREWYELGVVIIVYVGEGVREGLLEWH